MSSVSTLTKLGLSGTEAAIFLFLIQNGPSRAPSLQMSLSLNKVAVYRALKSLLDKGLLTTSGNKRLQIYSAEPLQNLLDQYDQNIQQMHHARADLEKVISELAKHENQLYKERKIGVFEGIEGLRLWYDERIRGKVDVIRELGPLCPALSLPEPPNGNKNLAIEVRRKRVEKNVRINCLFTEREENVPSYARTSRPFLRETRVLSIIDMPNICLSTFGSRFGFYSSNNGILRGMVVDDPMLACSLSLMFDTLWEQSKTI